MSISLFGWEIGKKEPDTIIKQNIIDVENDGSQDIVTLNSGGAFVQYLEDMMPNDEFELIKTYREISNYTEVDKAVSEIINDSIVYDNYQTPFPVQLMLDECDGLSENIKTKISDEFETILSMLNYNKFMHRYFRRWYVDGKIYYHLVVDEKKPKDGIQKIINLETTRIKKYRKINKKTVDGVDIVASIEEYFIYFPKEHFDNQTAIAKVSNPLMSKNVVKFNENSVAFSHSGLVDEEDRPISYLHKAIRPANQLRMMEDAAIVYRMVRAPERRVFYIDVGQLPKQKAEQYLSSIMAKYRNKVSYDSKTGKLNNGKDSMAMLEDFWLPRRDGKSTEIDTIGGSDTTNQIEEALYFRKKLYDSLNVPNTRIDSEQTFNFGRDGEITRDEIKFSKFVNNLRVTFSQDLFGNILKKQLLLKNIITLQDWERIERNINYTFIEDSHFTEMKRLEMLKNRLEVLTDINEHKTTYFSRDYIRKNVLQQTDEEIEELNKEREEEAKLFAKEDAEDE